MPNDGKFVEQLDLLNIPGESTKWYSQFRQLAFSYKYLVMQRFKKIKSCAYKKYLISRLWKQCRHFPIREWIHKLRFIHTAIKRNKLLRHRAAQMNLKAIVPCKARHRRTHTLMWSPGRGELQKSELWAPGRAGREWTRMGTFRCAGRFQIHRRFVKIHQSTGKVCAH